MQQSTPARTRAALQARLLAPHLLAQLLCSVKVAAAAGHLLRQLARLLRAVQQRRTLHQKLPPEAGVPQLRSKTEPRHA